MPTPTIETAAPSSASPNASSQTTPPDKPVESKVTPAAVPPVEPRSATSSFGAALDAASEGGSVTPPVKPAAKEKPAETKPADTKSKAAETKPGTEKKPDEIGDLPKLDSKSLLKKDEPKPKDDKAKSKDDKADEPLSEEELKEELENPHKKEKSQRRYRQLWDNWKKTEEVVATTKKELDAKNTKLAELEKQIKEAGDKAGVSPEIQKQLEELAMMKREKGLGDDPQVKQLFDHRVQKAEDFMMDILTKRQSPLPQSWVDTIKASGGLFGFKKAYPEEYGKMMDLLPEYERDEIDAALKEQRIIARQKTDYIDAEKSKAVQYFADKAKADAEAAALRPDPKKEAEVMQQRFATWKEGVKKEAKDIFGEQEIPADASDSVRKEITEKNRFARQLSAALDQRVAAKSPEEWQDILLEAVLAHKFAADNKTLRAENEALKAELETVRGAGKTITRGGAVTVPPVTKPAEGKIPSFAEAMEKSLQELEGQQ